LRVALDARHIRPRCQGLGDLEAAFYQNAIDDVERTMFETAFTEPLKNWPLRCLALVPQRIVHVTALFILCRQSRRRAQVGLINEHDHQFSVLVIRSMLDHPRVNLARRGTRIPLVRGPRGADRP
jgi:hypothetical protein